MSQIICQWLNDELQMSKPVDPKSFAKDFASGYLIGEVLYKYQLQDDFDQFVQSRAANSKLNNFSRMEPTLHLLGVPFDQNMAQAIMSEQHGAATRLLYQMYIVLQKKKNAGLTGLALESMRPPASAKLQSIETDLYRDRLKNVVPRQTDINLQHVTEQFEMKSKEENEKMARLHYEQLRKVKKIQEELRIQDIEKLRQAKRRQHEMLARIQAAIVHIPKPTTDPTLKAIEARKLLKKKKEAEDVYSEIMKFEKSHKESPSSSIHSTDRSVQSEGISPMSSLTAPALLKPDSTDEYIRSIQKRLEEDSVAREQREKRRRKILMEQLGAHEAQEEAYREEQLINRLMRQSQQERRIAVQLMHVRHEKEVLWQNRIFREKQYEERRLKEFQDALDREAALGKQIKIDNEEEIHKELMIHEKIAAERAEARYKKHYMMCQKVLDHIIDLVTKTGEYRVLTNNLIPFQLMREWKELFYTEKPIYEQASIEPWPSEPSLEQLVELEKLELLDEKGFEDYKTMAGEWIPPEDLSVKGPAPNNNVLGHIIYRLLDIVTPVKPETPPPITHSSSIKGCILGKTFAGKSTCLKYLAQAYTSIQMISIDTLVQEAVQSFHDNEMYSESGRNATQKEEVGNVQKLSVRAQIGEKAELLLKKGKSISDEVLIELMMETINNLPQGHGWIMDDFPMTVNQAKLLDRALTAKDFDSIVQKPKETLLVMNPREPENPPPPQSGMDFVVLLDISDCEVLGRAVISKAEPDSSEIHQIYDVQLPDNERRKNKNDPVIDQIEYRIAGFLDNWPALENWFSEKQNILIRIDGEMEESLLCKRMEEVLLAELVKKQKESPQLFDILKEIKGKIAETPSRRDSITKPGNTPIPNTILENYRRYLCKNH